MKKTVLAVILVLTAFFGAYGQNAAPNDILLVLDTSSNMSSSYDNVTNYITGSFLTEFLRVGDTFHLIPFSGNPRLDVARRITGVGDVETIIARMLLQYPVESGNNVGSALSFAELYITTLPGRPKKIILVTTGSSDTGNLVSASRQRLGSRNTIDYIQVTPGQPLTNLPVSGRPSEIRTTTTASTAGRTGTVSADTTGSSSRGTTTSDVQRSTTTTSDTSRSTTSDAARGASDTSPSITTQNEPSRNGSSGTTSQITSGESSSNENSTSGLVSTPLTTETNTQGSDTSETSRTSGQADTSSGQSSDRTGTSSQTTSRQDSKSSFSLSSSLPLIIGIILALLLLLLLILFLSSRRLGSSPNRVMADVASSGSKEDNTRFKDHSKDLATYAASAGSTRRSTPYDDHQLKKELPAINPTGPLLLNLFVSDQNTSIGKRNIHSLKSGYNLSVGGSKSDDYLIFLVPMPAGIGEIRRDGSTLTFTPRKAKYFPDIGNNQVRDCINKTIRVVSDKNYEMRFRFEMYEDPLVALNRMLMSVKVPG